MQPIVIFVGILRLVSARILRLGCSHLLRNIRCEVTLSKCATNSACFSNLRMWPCAQDEQIIILTIRTGSAEYSLKSAAVLVIKIELAIAAR